MWSAGQAYNHALRLDPSTDPPTISTLSMGHFVYGLGIDYIGHLFVSGWTDSRLSRVNTATSMVDWTYSKGEIYQGRGVACTADNDVWVASSAYNQVVRYDNDGNWKATIPVGNTPTGVAVDADGKVWACDNGDEYIYRINPATNTIELSKRLVGSGGHYSYSDMTGIVVRTVTTKIGTWTVVFDSGQANTPWGTVSWNSFEPSGTFISVRVRSSNDTASWSSWETSSNGVPLSATPNGRYLQIETTLQIVSGDVSPVLYDLTVAPTVSVPSATVCSVWTTDSAGNPKVQFDLGEPVYVHWNANGMVDMTVYAPDGVTVDQQWLGLGMSGVNSFIPSHGTGIYRIDATGAGAVTIGVGTFLVIPELPIGTAMALITMLASLLLYRKRNMEI